MPSLTTLAELSGLALAVYLAAWEIVFRRAPIQGPDEHDADPPTIWSDAVPPGGYVCAAPAANLPDGICGWPSEPCPEHGQLVTPGSGQ